MVTVPHGTAMTVLRDAILEKTAWFNCGQHVAAEKFQISDTVAPLFEPRCLHESIRISGSQTA
jgi:hypothetical protein